MKIPEDTFIPADLVLLRSTGAKGTCYVETKNLDGETNLKIKTTQKDLRHYFEQPAPGQEAAAWGEVSGTLTCEKPNPYLYKFEGTLHLPDKQRQPIALDAENVVLRGT